LSFGNFDLREPSLTSYIAALNAADARWAEESADIADSEEAVDGGFITEDAVVAHGMVTIPGGGNYEGWKLSGYADKGPRDGFHLTAPPREGERQGSVVGFVVLNRDGTWTACHDPWNHRPGIALGCTGVKVRVPSAEAAYRDVVVRQMRHEARHGAR
jgi:hypothetical protein